MSVGEEKSGAAAYGSVGCRRRWSDAQKWQIVAETHEPGVSVPMVAQCNLDANQVFRWLLLREPEHAGEREDGDRTAGRSSPGDRR